MPTQPCYGTGIGEIVSILSLTVSTPAGEVISPDEQAVVELVYGVEFDPCLRCGRPREDCPCERGNHMQWFLPRYGHLAPKSFHRIFKQVDVLPQPPERLL